MEVAGQWRREWAGSAEYGKVTEGGVTRRVARAMEVLHASAPGARVRVMRAAYHSSAGPGAPASSYLMHSSRQVISSGYNFLEPPSTSSKPLEISSTPFESLPDSEIERENYKVTEPDDYDISEPSKWRGSSGKNSIRMPSEESSSADNASIIDLDSRTNTFKRPLQSKHSDDKNRTHIITTRVSPLLDAPVALSTLKYTSLLNSSDDWNSRRKSYSFEDTSPLNQKISPQNNSSTMDSSTDSGICKSSEIVNDPVNCPATMQHTINTEKTKQDESSSFKNWLSKNRPYTYRESSMTPPRHCRTTEENESHIILQSSGKVSITLPHDTQKKSTPLEKSVVIDDNDRRTKKVEFCKTELHFTADTGTVNIIATDEKPPPSTDFRRRRSAFVPLNNKIDRSITLFGEKSELKPDRGFHNNEFGEPDENTAATKSILKNKIPKPKPYLLGENMAFGSSNIETNNHYLNSSLTKPSAVSLINSQLNSARRYSNETISSDQSEIDSSSVPNNTYRTGSKGPLLRHSHVNTFNNDSIEILDTKSPNKKAVIIPVSPEVNKTKIRELRGSDLAYFGIEKNENPKTIPSQDNLQEEIFHSVKLVQQVSNSVSNSVCNSEAESDDAPEYQNIPVIYDLSAIPTPTPRSKYDKEARKYSEQKVLKPIREQEPEHVVLAGITNDSLKIHNDRLTPLHQHITVQSRKIVQQKECRQKETRNNIESVPVSPRKVGNNSLRRIKSNKENETSNSTRDIMCRGKRNSVSPVYVNINAREKKEKQVLPLNVSRQKDDLRRSTTNDPKFDKQDITSKKSSTSSSKGDSRRKEPKESLPYENTDRKFEIKQENRQSTKRTPKRTEKLVTPENMQRNSNEQTPRHTTNVSASKSNSTHTTQRGDTTGKRNKNESSTKIALGDEDSVGRKGQIPSKDKGATITKDLNTHNTASLCDNKTSSKSNKIVTIPQTPLAVHPHKANKTSDIKLDKLTKPKRSKYVINYDDKNGTVSSICKIKKGPGTYKRKMISIENKHLQDPTNTNNKSLNKIALLQFPDRNWNTYNQDSKNRIWKSNAHVQRSCQLL